VNPILQQLGYAADDRVLIIHADDIGMCQATLPALADLLDFGLLSSAAVMVPCPWFPQTAAFCRAHPTVDMGVHLTVNCEWQGYRWGPISTSDPATGLLDEKGYFPAQPAVVAEQANVEVVATELRAQVTRALAAGVDATHVDAHMGSVLHPKFSWSYCEIAQDHRLPAFFLSRAGEERLYERGFSRLSDGDSSRVRNELETQNLPLFDDIAMLPLNDPVDQVAQAKQIVANLRPGLTVLILHPAVDTPELRAITADWPSRVANYETCLSVELRDYVQQTGVQVIGYRPLRELIRKNASG
jgi:chitin disaccharide deacetylase